MLDFDAHIGRCYNYPVFSHFYRFRRSGVNIKELEAKVRRLDDIEAITRLQRVYGYYLHTDRQEKIIDMFSDDTESVEVADRGLFRGKEGVRKFFGAALRGSSKRPRQPGDMEIPLQLQAVIDVAKDGKTAKGRWQTLIIGAKPVAGVKRQTWAHGVYENEYVKENGEWKFKKLHFNLTFRTPYEDGWLKTPVIDASVDYPVKPDAMPTAYHPYPSGYTVPFHWDEP
jgi:hypothetical protein